MYTGCVITIYLPYSPDYDLSVETVTGVTGFLLFGATKSLSYTVDAN